MKKTQAVGIDLGTTYSCVAVLNEHGFPLTLPNQEGELATPSAVYFDDSEIVIGTEALRNAIARPGRVIQNAKRFMGDSEKTWTVAGRKYSPEDIAAMILRKLIAAAQDQVGEVTDAVITVPAQFSDAARHATITAGHAAGLERVEIINEPVAAALCHVLGNEGLAFTELAIDQQLLVFDLGGGTLDLAVVNYTSNAVRVVASDGDLELGGIDWTGILVKEAAERFDREFGHDPREDPQSHQALALEAEQAKRSLSVRPRAAVTVHHAGQRRTYQISQEEFVRLSGHLVRRCEEVTRRILKENRMGWAHINVVLLTGGSSRMPMVRGCLKKLSGRTLNSSLSPDQSIAHGAALYAGMLLANQQYARTVFNSSASERLAAIRQQSVNARALGILVRNAEGERVPHYIIPPNCALPVARTHVFGTVVDGQNRVHVRIVESGAGSDRPHMPIGDCVISELPRGLPEGSKVEVTISYDHQARVHVSARELQSGRSAEVEIIRQENMAAQLQKGRSESGSAEEAPATELSPGEPLTAAAGPNRTGGSRTVQSAKTRARKRGPEAKPASPVSAETMEGLEELSRLAEFTIDDSDQPMLLCNACGNVLGRKGECHVCGTRPKGPQAARKRSDTTGSGTAQAGRPRKMKRAKPSPPDRVSHPSEPAAGSGPASSADDEDEFWKLMDES